MKGLEKNTSTRTEQVEKNMKMLELEGEKGAWLKKKLNTKSRIAENIKSPWTVAATLLITNQEVIFKRVFLH